MFDAYLQRWNLVADGAPVVTAMSRLLPARRHGEPVMLKLALSEDERRGAGVLEWWAGEGAARVLARDREAVLMERALGAGSLAQMARTGRDDEASRILCAAAGRLHAARGTPPAGLPSLDDWFAPLEPAAGTHGGILRRSADAARHLLAEPREVAVLHGDLHHDNVLDFGPRGWLAIDPKGVIGERGFDLANTFTNPDLSDPQPPVSTVPERFARRLEVVAEAARIERRRLLLWVLAWTGLSAVWYIEDGDPATVDLTVAQMAAAELDR